MKSLFWGNGIGDVADFKNYKIHRFFSDWEEKTTDSSGDISITNYKTNTPVYIQKADKSAAKIITGSTTTLSTGWASTDVLVRYQLLTPSEESINMNEVALLPGDNDLNLSKGVCANIQGNKKYMEG
jgi:hypothetical protein